MLQATVIVLTVVVAVLLFLFLKFRKESISYHAKLHRYSGIVDLDAAIAAAKHQFAEAEQRAEQVAADDKRRRGDLETQYKQAVARYEQLQHEVSLLEENLEDISFGLYKPH